MKLFKTVYWLIYPILIVVFMLIFDQLFEIDNIILETSGSLLLAFILSPRKKIIQTEQNMQELTKKMQRTIDVNVSQIGTLKSKLTAAEGVNLHLKEENMELKKQLLKKNDAIDALVEANLARERAERAAKESNEENMKLKNHLQTSDRTIAELRHALAMKTEENNQLRQASESKNGGGGVDQETIDGIEMLEKHLIKLSEKLRNKNNEVEQLQAVIHRECIQRGRLMDELIELRGV